MRVTRIACHRLQARLARPFTSPSGLVHETEEACLVELECDTGLTGWGECAGAAVLAQAAVEQLAPLVLGRDPFDCRVIRAELGRRVRHQGGAGAGLAAISGIDIALHDLMGRALGRPIHQLLGGAFRAAVPACAAGLAFADPAHLLEEAVDEAAHHVQQGFRAIRMRIGVGDLVADVARIKAVRDAVGPDVRLVVDAEGSFAPPQAIRLGRALEALDVSCFANPVPADDIAGQAEVARSLDIAVAGAGAEASAQGVLALLQARALDLAEPAPCLAGGISETMRIAGLCAAHGVECLPRAGGSAVGMAAALHLLAALPDHPPAWRPFPPLFTFDPAPSALRDALVTMPLALGLGGVVAVPQGPGLGIEIDRGALERLGVG